MSARPPDIDVLQRQATAALATGDWHAAEQSLRACLAIRSDDPALSYNLALVEKRLGKHEDAERRLAGVVAAAPGHARARFELAASLMDRGDETGALGEFEIYLRADPDDPDARLNAGRLCLRLGEAKAAETHLAAAARSSPGDPAIRLARAEAVRDLGDLDRSTAMLRALFGEASALRPAILKVMSQGPRGRIPLRAERCGAG